MEEFAALHNCEGRSAPQDRYRRNLLTFEGQEVVLWGLGEVEKLDDGWVVRATHDLDLFRPGSASIWKAVMKDLYP